MFLSRFFGRLDVRPAHRPLPRRRPRLENLEGRQLQAAFDIVGQHIGTNIVGQHIGMDVAGRKHVSADAVVGSHIGTNLIVGQHIG